MDIKAYESVVKKHSPALYRYCLYRLSFNEQLVEETVNDILRVLFIKWDTLDLNNDILPYLYRVADNCIMQAKERDHKYYSAHSSLEEAIEEGIISETHYCDDYFHDLDAENAFIQEVIKNLPEEYQIIFKYRFYDKKTIAEIALLTNIPYSSLRLRIIKIEEYIRCQVKNNY